MDFYTNTIKTACPCCGSLEIVKLETNSPDVKDCFCGVIAPDGELIRSSCQYEWKEHN